LWNVALHGQPKKRKRKEKTIKSYGFAAMIGVNVCKFRSILNTFSIDENFKKRGGGFRTESQKIKKNPNHDSRKLMFAIFENFTDDGESIRDINRGSRE
jgi:hypothetical protein